MRCSHKKLYPILFIAALLTACNNGDDDISSNGPLKQFSSNMGDSKEIMAPVALKQNITSLFGTADSEPVEVNNKDTVSSLIQRSQ